MLSAIINEGARFEGALFFSGDAKISGTVTGTIVCNGRLQISETAIVHADLKVNQLQLSGVLSGDIKATSSVEMIKPARFEGVVVTPSLSVESGVIFHGKSEYKV